MGKLKGNLHSITIIKLILVLIIVSGLSLNVRYAQAQGDEGKSKNPAAIRAVAQLFYQKMAVMGKVYEPDIKKHLGFCIKDVDDEWNRAFNFSSDLDFLGDCMTTTQDIGKRMCTAAEVRLFFTSLISKRRSSTYLKPNKNCNLTAWIDGCEPGWACRVIGEEKAVMNDTVNVPDRSEDCQPCCAGFFCPKGVTCMIPCPLGSYCPAAKLNQTTGICEPYKYQIPAGKPNHTCGGADIWADVVSSSEVFCAPGSYCPSTTKTVSCRQGHYCRKGSTKENKCFDLASCDRNSSSQNIHAYGILIIAVLSVSLLLVYNCSDQVLTTREQRLAASRERGLKSAKETAQAQEKWKSARDTAMKHATSIQQTFSRTFSRAKSVKTDPSKPFGAPSPRPVPNAPSSSTSSTAKPKKPANNLTKMMQEIEENPESHDGFEIGGEKKDSNVKKPKAKDLHTRSQIFKYAYGKLEQEKAMEQQRKDLTFSGIIKMGGETEFEIRKRPILEVAFKDLTLTLKGKNKQLLRSITGKMLPGRVAAVMGPSGAGKTTFLSAVCGKVRGCNVTGSVLINGKNESIHSYKKIIGFVPQDDVVHGDLTVEENLRFSARCRLPAELPKADKVLVVERVIEALGLQAIRDSLVGTVEKRGISGGQRKRVNVGLEMVMEPSLLILDEPTSGLDSSSSVLLLKALRREALEGVNISMVIHQPSYTLFKMFDDFILLAKGGLTVYHGSVRKVEEYFTSLGITVPERVTPPDHYIDILEGIIKPGSNVTREQLPVRWMLHNGYPVPQDLLHLCDEISGDSPEGSSGGSRSSRTKPPESSFFRDMWLEMKSNIIMRRDHLMHNFLNEQDLSNRTTSGVMLQYRYFLGRNGKQRLREADLQAVDYLILLVAGFILGTLAKVSDETFGAIGYNYTVIAVSLLSKISALRSFTYDRLQFWRESASGMSCSAYFLSKDTIDLFNVAIKPLVYLSMFYFLNNPRSSFAANYLILFALVYCTTGIAYILALCLEPGPAQLVSVLLPVVLSLIASQEKDNEFMYELGKFTYTKWALEAFVITNAKNYYGVWLVTRCGSMHQSGYNLNDWTRCLIYLFVCGVVSRMVAFFFLLIFQKK